MALWIKDPLAILAAGAERGVVVDGTGIAECVGAGREPRSRPLEVFDASRHVVLPGLVNTHHHFYQTLTRAHPGAIDRELFDWLVALYPIWAGLEPEGFRLAVRVALAELLLSGCTTAVDHHYVYPPGLEHAIDIEVEEARALGVRVHLARGSMDLSRDDGGLPPASVVQTPDEILADSQRTVEAFHDPEAGAMVRIALAPCSPFSVTTGLMAETASLAGRLGVRLHTHLAESEDENAFCERTHGCRPLDYLESVGWLGPGTWIAHGIHFTDGEIRRLGEHASAFAHCPSSNHILASGHCRVPELEAASAPVGLAVDGSASQDSSNLVQEVRQAFFLQRMRYGAARISHRDALRWATEGSARCLGRDDIGVVAPGRQADLALFTLDELRFSGSGDPLAALVLCGAHRADRVMVAGKWVVEDGGIPGLDVDALRHAHQAAARKLGGLG